MDALEAILRDFEDQIVERSCGSPMVAFFYLSATVNAVARVIEDKKMTETFARMKRLVSRMEAVVASAGRELRPDREGDGAV